MALRLPPGVKFVPTDKQLLECYLKPKICGNYKLPIDLIKEKEIYGPKANPWEIFNDSTTQWITGKREPERVVYIFASLTKIADKESSGVQGNEHNARKAGCGMWHDETGRKPVMEGNVLIGHKRMLVFQIIDINGLGDGFYLNKVGYWKMHEYFLHGFENLVVCRITFDISKTAKVIKSVSGTRGSSTRSKVNKKIATSICTTKDDREKAVIMIESSHIFRNSGMEVAPNHDSRIVNSNYTVGGRDYSSGLIYENQRCHEENLLASTNSVCRYGSDQGPRYGSDQGLILNTGLPQHDNGSNFRVKEQECQGFAANDDQKLNYDEENRPHYGCSDQGLILNTGLPQYDNGRNFRVEEQECQGFAANDDQKLNYDEENRPRYGSDQGLILNTGLPQYDNGSKCQGFAATDDQRLNYEEEAQPVIRTNGDFENHVGTVLSDFNSGPDDDLNLDFDDLFDGDFWSDMNNVLPDDVSLGFGSLFDSEKEMEEFLGQIDNNVQEKQQQPTQNMSCMLGKRESFEAQEDHSGPSKKSRI